MDKFCYFFIHRANDWEFFTIGNQYYLIVSNTVSSTSDVYRLIIFLLAILFDSW